MKGNFSLFTLLLVLVLTACTAKQKPSSETNSSEKNEQFIWMEVNKPQSRADSEHAYQIPVAGKLTIREVLQQATITYKHFKFTDTLYLGMGHLLTGINGVRNAKGSGAYWQFCIDNVASDRGIDEKEILPGQALVWHYAEYGKLPCKKIGE